MKTFKEYLKKKRKYPTLETVFGSHSINVNEELEQKHQAEYSPIMTNRVHSVVAPMNNSVLSDEEETSLRKYSAGSFPINDFLHRNHKEGFSLPDSYDRKISEHIDNIDSALDKHKTTEPTSVYTGLKESPASKLINGVTKPSIVHLPAFTSTSTSYESASNFSRPVDTNDKDKEFGVIPNSRGTSRHMLKIHLPKGTNAMSMMNCSEHSRENEILLHRGHNIEINPTPELSQDGTHIWHAKVVSHQPTVNNYNVMLDNIRKEKKTNENI